MLLQHYFSLVKQLSGMSSRPQNWYVCVWTSMTMFMHKVVGFCWLLLMWCRCGRGWGWRWRWQAQGRENWLWAATILDPRVSSSWEWVVVSRSVFIHLHAWLLGLSPRQYSQHGAEPNSASVQTISNHFLSIFPTAGHLFLRLLILSSIYLPCTFSSNRLCCKWHWQEDNYWALSE